MNLTNVSNSCHQLPILLVENQLYKNNRDNNLISVKTEIQRKGKLVELNYHLFIIQHFKIKHFMSPSDLPPDSMATPADPFCLHYSGSHLTHNVSC